MDKFGTLISARSIDQLITYAKSLGVKAVKRKCKSVSKYSFKVCEPISHELIDLIKHEAIRLEDEANQIKADLIHSGYYRSAFSK